MNTDRYLVDPSDPDRPPVKLPPHHIEIVESPKPSILDIQIGGEHYKKLGQYQPWQVAAACMTPAELRGYMKGTVLAYIMREGDKGGDQDIEKAKHTIELWQEVRKDK